MNELLRKLLMLPEQASTAAPGIDGLHYVVIGVSTAGWAVCTLLGTYFVIRYRRRAPGQVTRNVGAALWFELCVAVALFVLFIGWWLVGFRQFVGAKNAPADALEVYVTGKQWMWKFAYPDGRNSIGILTVPVGRPVKLMLTSRDVIHSFYVPAFRIKQDAVPGRYTTLWFEATKAGSYQVFCTEYCGLSHSNMRGSVVALEPEAFARWRERTEPGDREPGAGTAETPPTPLSAVQAEPSLVASVGRNGPEPSMAERGAQVAVRYGCLSCHRTDGVAHIGPPWNASYGRARELVDGRSIVADEAYLTRSMMDPLVELVRGYGPVMPSYQGILDVAETGALVAYIKSLRQHAPTPMIPAWDGTVPAPSGTTSERPGPDTRRSSP